MMKSTFATLALASVAMTASAASESALYSTLVLSEADACKTPTVTLKTVEMIPANIFYIEAATVAEVEACIDSIEAETDRVVVSEAQQACVESVEAGGFTVKAGTNASCAMAKGGVCTAETICENVAGSPEDQKSCVVQTDTTKNFCPTGFAPTTGDFVKLVVGSDLVVKSADWNKSVGAAWAAANTAAAECDFSEADAEYISNAKATEVTQMLLDAACDADKQKAWKTAFDAALKAYNDDAKNTVKATGSVTFSKTAASGLKACFNNKVTATTPEWFCATTKDCTIPCSTGASCTDAKQCGTGKCAAAPKAAMITQADEAKVCVPSSSVMAVVAPVLAAVLAVAFF